MYINGIANQVLNDLLFTKSDNVKLNLLSYLLKKICVCY